MAGFSQNKAPGAGGKQAIKADRLVGVGAVSDGAVDNGDDIFIISRLGKIIRFRVDETRLKRVCGAGGRVYDVTRVSETTFCRLIGSGL